jgi:dTDP-4-dehydrorhamnose reductase
MVGSALMDVLSPRFELIGLGHEALDITEEQDTVRTVQDIRPGIVIHSAGYTDVDGCEKDPDRAVRVNSQGTLHVARACDQAGARLVYMSTDYVFDGNASRPYSEEDPVNPLNIYGQSKLEGERHILRLLEEFTIVRTQWLFGKEGKNFVATVLDSAGSRKPLKAVRDQIGSPTYVVDLSRAILSILESSGGGVFHVANSSSCSWYDFAVETLRIAEISDIEIIPVDEASLGRPARRPLYSVLDCGKLMRETGLKMRTWQNALKDFLKEGDLS